MKLSSRDEDKLFFLHVPKTAGSSFTRILKSLYDEADIFHQMDTPSLIQLLASGDHHHRLYIGHYYHEALDRFPVKPRVVTFLRDPRERVISHYYYYQKQSPEAVEKMAPWDKVIVDLTRKYSFDDFISLDMPEVEQAFSNVQVRHIGTNTDDLVPADESGRTALVEKAMANLKAMDYVGIVEHFDDSIALFCRQFELSDDIKPVSVNVNKSRPQPRGEVSVFDSNPIARGRVELDQQLYDLGLTLFRERQPVAAVTTPWWRKLWRGTRMTDK